MTRSAARRALIVVGVLVALLLVAADLLRSDSLIMGALDDARPERETPPQRLMRVFLGDRAPGR